MLEMVHNNSYVIWVEWVLINPCIALEFFFFNQVTNIGQVTTPYQTL